MALDLTRFNRNVAAEMARSGLTQIDLAGMLGMHQTALSRRLTGRTEWTLSEAKRVADVLGVELSVLLPEAAVA